MTKAIKKLNKIQKLDEKIEQMQKEKERILQETHKTIGEAITKEWDTYDVTAILFAIKELKFNAQELMIPIENNEDDSEDTINNAASSNPSVTNN